MSEQGISRQGLGNEFAAVESRKANLVLEAKMLAAQQRADEAAVLYAQAAEMEEQLAGLCESAGQLDLAWVHRFGEVRGWALAGNVHSAIRLGESMIARPELPERLRRTVAEYVQGLRNRRARWSAELVSAGAEA